MAQATIEERTELTGVRKAAVFLLSVGQETAAEVFRRLDAETVQEVSREIASLKGISVRQRDEVMQEFYNLALASSYLEEGGLSYATTLLRRSLPGEEAERIIRRSRGLTEAMMQQGFIPAAPEAPRP